MQDVSKILTRKYYGKKDPFRSREFRQPRWMELLAVLLFTVSGLGEGKSINVVLGGLPKAVMLAFVGLAGLEFFIRGDFDRLKNWPGRPGCTSCIWRCLPPGPCSSGCATSRPLPPSPAA